MTLATGALAVVAFVLHLFVHGYVLGLIHGLYAVAFLAALELVHLVTTGSAYRVAGAWGEDNTREVLRVARRRRSIYGWLDSLEVGGGDVDHLVASPSGWWAIDSKWHTGSATAALVARDAATARRSAQRARSALRSVGHVADVRPVVVIWGPMQSEVPSGRVQVDDVLFVAGRSLKAWLGDEAIGDREELRGLTRAQATGQLRTLVAFRNRLSRAPRRVLPVAKRRQATSRVPS